MSRARPYWLLCFALWIVCGSLGAPTVGLAQQPAPAELSPEEKSSRSHRGKALSATIKYLETLLKS